MTVQELLQLNWADIQATTREGGWNAHYYHTKMFEELWGHIEAQSLTKGMIEEWAADRKKIRAVATVKHELALLRRAFNLAYRAELIDINPFSRVKVKLKLRHRTQVLTPANEQILAGVYSLHLAMGDLLWTQEKFALLTGLRIGEQAYMTRDHIREDICMVPKEGKTGERPVPMGTGAQAIAKFWMEISRDCNSPWLFWPTAGDDRPAVAEKHSKEVYAKARLIASGINPGLITLQRRDFRRTFACDLIAAGVPIYEVQKLLGHATTAQTQVYCQVGLTQLREAVRTLDKKTPNPGVINHRERGLSYRFNS